MIYDYDDYGEYCGGKNCGSRGVGSDSDGLVNGGTGVRLWTVRAPAPLFMLLSSSAMLLIIGCKVMPNRLTLY